MYVRVENLGEHALGNPLGQWVTLPASQADLEQTMRDDLRIAPGTEREHYMLSDVRRHVHLRPLWGFEYDQYRDLYTLNAIAQKAALADAAEIEIVGAYVQGTGGANANALLNIWSQAENIAFREYCYEDRACDDAAGPSRFARVSKEENLGYTLLEKTKLGELLDEKGLWAFFDVRGFGAETASRDHLILLDNGYIDVPASPVDRNRFGPKELIASIGKGWEKAVSERKEGIPSLSGECRSAQQASRALNDGRADERAKEGDAR